MLRRSFLIGASAGLVLPPAVIGPAHALTPAQQLVLFGGSGRPSWLPTADGVPATNFADYRTEGGANRYYNNGLLLSNAAAWWTSRGTGSTFARASSAFGVPSTGLLTSYATNAARRPVVDPSNISKGLGMQYEGARTGIVLWNRDLTNAAWTLSNTTSAKDQAGTDGVTNAASSLTATANNGTIFQSITTASVQRAQAAYVKRITGTGTVSISMDGGSTYTDVTASINSSTYTRVPTGAGLIQTLANPTVGFKLGTSGDKIAVDFVTNEAGAFVSSPTLQTTGSVTRSADSQSLTRTAPTSITKVIAGRTGVSSSVQQAAWTISNGSTIGTLVWNTNGTIGIAGSISLNSGVTVAANTDFVAAITMTGSAISISVNGSSVVSSAQAIPSSATTEIEGNYVGGALPWYSTIKGTAEWTNFTASNAALQALSGSAYWN